MANEIPTKPTTPFTTQTPVQVQGQDAIQNLADAISKLGQVQLELVTQGIKSSIAVFEPLSKASIELTANALTSFNQILQNFSASISPKQ